MNALILCRVACPPPVGRQTLCSWAKGPERSSWVFLWGLARANLERQLQAPKGRAQDHCRPGQDTWRGGSRSLGAGGSRSMEGGLKFPEGRLEIPEGERLKFPERVGSRSLVRSAQDPW